MQAWIQPYSTCPAKPCSETHVRRRASHDGGAAKREHEVRNRYVTMCAS